MILIGIKHFKQFNYVRYDVKAVTSTTITLTTVYSAGATGGVVNRMNEGLNVHISILDESFNVIAVLYHQSIRKMVLSRLTFQDCFVKIIKPNST